MIYQLYEAQRALLSPFAEFASASSKLYSHPLSPFAHAVGSQRMAAGFDLLHRLTKEYEKPPFEITSVNIGGVDVAVQEQVAAARPFCRLLRFKRYTDNAQALERMRSQPSVLVVAPLSGQPSTLLRDTVRTLLQDHQVYITDWVDARMVPMSDGAFPSRFSSVTISSFSACRTSAASIVASSPITARPALPRGEHDRASLACGVTLDDGAPTPRCGDQEGAHDAAPRETFEDVEA